MAKLYMLIGVPAAGKSTWVSKAPLDWNNTVIASTDNYIEKVAKKENKTYTDVFQDNIQNATNYMNNAIKNAIANNQDIVWDQTNLNRRSREKKLKQIPNNYKKIAVVFKTPNMKELTDRLNQREGKNIPVDVLKNMINSFQEPTSNEGFDEIIFV